MGKILKYCSSCEEGFAEKFSFCPNCAGELSAFEMKPVEDAAPEPETPSILEVDEVQDNAAAESSGTGDILELVENEPNGHSEGEEKVVIDEAVEPEPEPVVEAAAPAVDEAATVEADTGIETIVDEEVATVSFEAADVELADEEEDHATEAAAGSFLGLIENVVPDGNGSMDYDEILEKETAARPDPVAGFDRVDLEDDENYHVTVIADKSSNIRNGLLLGSFLVISIGFFVLLLNSLFNNLEDVASLTDDATLIALLDETPVLVEEQEQKKDDDEGGGGGGGGKNEEKDVSQGELVSQSRNVVTPPSSRTPRLEDPSLPVNMETEGDIKRARTLPPGLENSLNIDPSDGPGSGGGMGRGRGTGMGDGFGTGEGTGTGSGSGSGIGDGTGSGRGRGRGVGKPPPVRKGPTVGIKILSKPRPGYTDAARQNNVRGTVMLRVTFLSNGRIGGVSTVKGLPYGLTEKAIAAARQIRFKPPMRNGRPYTVRKVVHFNFTIY